MTTGDRIREIYRAAGRHDLAETLGDRFDAVPLEHAERIAKTTIINRTPTVVATVTRRARKNGWIKSRIKNRMLERQNHRCCYCGNLTERDAATPSDLATYEHVVSLRDGGDNSFRNLVIACGFCNRLRDSLDMSAMDFYQWVVDNRPEYQRRKAASRALYMNKLRQRRRK